MRTGALFSSFAFCRVLKKEPRSDLSPLLRSIIAKRFSLLFLRTRVINVTTAKVWSTFHKEGYGMFLAIPHAPPGDSNYRFRVL
jgi:hypothetical protein